MAQTIAYCFLGFMGIVVFSFVAALIECEYEAWMHSRGYYHQDARWIKHR